MVQQHNYNVLNTKSHSYAHIPAAISFKGCSLLSQYRLKWNYRLTEEKYEMEICQSWGNIKRSRTIAIQRILLKILWLRHFKPLICAHSHLKIFLSLYFGVSYCIWKDIYLNLQKSMVAVYCAFLTTEKWGFHLLTDPCFHFSISAKLLQTPTISNYKEWMKSHGKRPIYYSHFAISQSITSSWCDR